MTEPEFRKWPSTPRLFRPIVITEKIDGTNACVIVSEDGSEVWAQSRNKLITPDDDNAGFARWVADNAGVLADVLGPGYHFGEWWGSKIQRTYGLVNGDKRFSLFNVKLYEEVYTDYVPGLGLVPVLYQGRFSEWEIDVSLEILRAYGSVAAPGFMNPEGIVVYHTAMRAGFKVLLENDHISKTEAGVK
ncbi:RNA ligase family protein [Saccharopolyspora pogona]|uniref:RNA ligase family protein n=1 Tax=Saccharopolyspora pogona TaxID=333966 RepID=UPI0016822458|nr:RNA ligase family protein [Saccharopolyspora pogona]